MEKLITPGSISKATGIPLFTVQYYLQSRGIEPIGRAGRLRVYGSDVIERIKGIYESIHGGKNEPER